MIAFDCWLTGRCISYHYVNCLSHLRLLAGTTLSHASTGAPDLILLSLKPMKHAFFLTIRYYQTLLVSSFKSVVYDFPGIKTVVSIYFDLQLPPLGPNIFFCFSNHQGVEIVFFLLFLLPSSVFQWHKKGNIFSNR